MEVVEKENKQEWGCFGLTCAGFCVGETTHLPKIEVIIGYYKSFCES